MRMCKNLRIVRNHIYSRTLLGRVTKVGESPVCEMYMTVCVLYLSTTGHEKSCRNPGGPPSKAKYEIATDSE